MRRRSRSARAALKAALIETRAKLSGAEALIAHLQLVIAKMKRAMFGPRSERSQRLIDQLELQLEELAAAAGEDETKAEAARVHVQGFTRRQGTRRNFPSDLPRRRIVHPAPTSCPCCGGGKLCKIGEDFSNRPLKTAGMTGYVCTPRAALAGIPSRRA